MYAEKSWRIFFANREWQWSDEDDVWVWQFKFRCWELRNEYWRNRIMTDAIGTTTSKKLGKKQTHKKDKKWIEIG